MAELKKTKKLPYCKVKMKKLAYKKRALLRRLSGGKKAEMDINKSKRTYHEQKAFNKNPYRYPKKLVPSSNKGSPEFDKKTCEGHFKKTYSDINRSK